MSVVVYPMVKGTPVAPVVYSATSSSVVRLGGHTMLEQTTRTYVLSGPVAPGWSVVAPIVLTLERMSDGEYLASDEVIDMYGCGTDQNAAVLDYVQSLIEYYAILESHAPKSAPNRALFDHLRMFFSPLPA